VYIQSPVFKLSAEKKEETVARLEKMLRVTFGIDPKLYGKTLDDEDFDWASLRGKYVLIKFTATWCGPCQAEISGMLEAYKKYHNKGFEIVSVYVWQDRYNDDNLDPVEMVKKHVEEKKLPWIILSEALTEKANQPKQGDVYVARGIPVMVLVDKEGKIMMTDARTFHYVDDALNKKLAEIFK
jgi:thiol-disulfide isomerase/thioredoxin